MRYIIKQRMSDKVDWFQTEEATSYLDFKEKFWQTWKSISHASNPEILVIGPHSRIHIRLEEGTPIEIKRELTTVGA